MRQLISFYTQKEHFKGTSQHVVMYYITTFSCCINCFCSFPCDSFWYFSSSFYRFKFWISYMVSCSQTHYFYSLLSCTCSLGCGLGCGLKCGDGGPGPTLSNTNCLGINCMIKTVSVHRLDNVIDYSIAEQWFLLIWVEESLWHSTYLLDFCSALISFSLSIVGFRLSSLFLFQISRFHFFLI